MNVKQMIQKELDELVVAIAELYTPLVSDESSDEEFSTVAEAVAIARDQVISNLATLAEVIIEDTLEEVRLTEVKQEARLRKLVPADIAIKPPLPEAPAPPVAPYTAPVLESSAPLPREVKEATTALELPQDFAQAAQQALSNSSLQMAGPDVDLADNPDYSHNLGLTLAEEKRREMGLPVKLYRPTVNFGRPEKVVPDPVSPAPEVADKTNFTLEEIEEEARGK